MSQQQLRKVRKVFTTRRGGHSTGPYGGFNLGDHVGDDPTAVAANRTHLAQVIGLPEHDVVYMEQIHSPNVTVVSRNPAALLEALRNGTSALSTAAAPETQDAAATPAPQFALETLASPARPGTSANPAAPETLASPARPGTSTSPATPPQTTDPVSPEPLESPDGTFMISAIAQPVEFTDALVTVERDLALVVLTADCVPLLLSDDVTGIIAAVHAGRLGARNGIVRRTIDVMKTLGAHPAHIHALFGASISGPNYEVPAEMARDVERRLPGSQCRTTQGTIGLDLRAGLTRQLISLGVTHIDADPRCTFDEESLFSYRRSGTTGRQAGVVWMPSAAWATDGAQTAEASQTARATPATDTAPASTDTSAPHKSAPTTPTASHASAESSAVEPTPPTPATPTPAPTTTPATPTPAPATTTPTIDRAALAARLAAVREQIAEAARAAGRNPEDISLLPVTKFHPVEMVAALGELGIHRVGENREQEARAKAQALAGSDIQFDMIGQIQSNKVNHVARWASRVHTVDSVALATGLNRGVALALERGIRPAEQGTLDAFVQWSVDGDPTRGGACTEDLHRIADAIAEAEHLRLAGLMVVPPLGADPTSVFAAARELADELREWDGCPGELSAGMSGDMAEAIAAGSTIVRVGTAIVGPRPVSLDRQH